jgi:hypothetical protein
MDNFLSAIEAQAHSSLNGARIIGLIHTERDQHNGYLEDLYVVAWQRDSDGEFGTHKINANNQGDVMVHGGNYRIASREAALSDMLERAEVASEEVVRLRRDLELSVCYSPGAIRDSFDGADEDHPDAMWVKQATDEQLLDVAYMIVGGDLVWKDFHSNIEMGLEEVRAKAK